jgi:hypothetical protein
MLFLTHIAATAGILDSKGTISNFECLVTFQKFEAPFHLPCLRYVSPVTPPMPTCFRSKRDTCLLI